MHDYNTYYTLILLVVTITGLAAPFLSAYVVVAIIIGYLPSLKEEQGYQSFCADASVTMMVLFFCPAIYGIYLRLLSRNESQPYYETFSVICFVIWTIVWLQKRTYTKSLAAMKNPRSHAKKCETGQQDWNALSAACIGASLLIGVVLVVILFTLK